jgi:aminoglycoside phosphotransferase (APT) family kinase protein
VNAVAHDLGDNVVDWISAVTSAADVTIERRSGGASRAGYAVTVTLPGGSVQDLWLRTDTGAGPLSSGLYTVRREAAVYQQLAGRGLQVADVVAIHPTIDAFLMTRISGDNQFSRLAPDDQLSVATQLMKQLATLHRIDVHDLDLPELGKVGALSDHIQAEIDTWEAQFRTHADPEPTIELALAWLRQALPEDDRPVSLVHGDCGPGNFMIEDGRLTAVTDWELAHFGDPLDDLAWLYVHDLQERMPDLAERLADYARFSGRGVDLHRLHYFLVLAQMRCAIGTRNGVLARDSRGEIAGLLIYSTLHNRALADALALAVGIPLEESAAMPEPGDSERSWMYDIVLDDLRARIVPAIEDSFVSRRAKGAARVVKVLREEERYEETLARAERADLERLVPGPVRDVTDARRELCELIRSRRVAAAEVVGYCVRHWDRRTQVSRPAMGVLADRRYSPLPASDFQAR